MSQSQPIKPEHVLESRTLYKGRILNLRLDKIVMDGDYHTEREIVEHGQVVAIVPLDNQGNVILVRQYRLAIGEISLEIPAGGMDKGETPPEAAIRELREETGLRAGQLESLGGFYVSPGYCTEYIHLYVARQLSEDPLTPDEDEVIHVESYPLTEAPDLIATQKITDAKSIIGLLRAHSPSNSDRTR